MSYFVNKKVLIVSWHFPPYKTSSAFNLFKRLKDTGYEYDVLQIKRAEKPDNEMMFSYSASRFNSYEIQVPSENSRDVGARKVYVEKVLDFFHKLNEKNHYSAMISHSHEIASHMAAMAIKDAYPDLRWVASFGDPIAANPFNESYKFPLLEEDSITEARVLQKADRIIVTNPYQQGLVTSTQMQPVDESKFFVLPHCFDERMYPSQTEKPRFSLEHGDIFRFKHVGMLYKYKRTSEPFLLGAQRLLKNHPELKGRFVLEFYGANDRYIQSAADYGLEGVASFKGNVSYLESLEVMTTADCLLLRDADFSDQGLKATPFYPGKLADYLGAKKPVLAVTMSEGCVPDMLSKLGGASLTENDIDGIANAMLDAINGKLNIDFHEADKYSYTKIAELAKKALTFSQDKKKILIAGHDLKFAKFLIEKIESSSEFELLIDQWQGHNKHDEEKSKKLLSQADVVFCEWGLGNIVWYSNNIRNGQKLIVRIHAQELKTRHLDACNHNNIHRYIFVSPYFYELMISEFSLERKKCQMFFNMVDTRSLRRAKKYGSEFNIGMIGYVPYSKRIDKALDIFESLYEKDTRYKLYLKGNRPEDFPWMHSKGKSEEMNFYKEQFERINNSVWGANVFFDGFGPIDEWLEKIGYVVSVSDNESFHLAVAEGMASGAVPVILEWPGARFIYPERCIFECVDEVVESILCQENNFKFSVFNEKFDKDNIANDILEIL